MKKRIGTSLALLLALMLLCAPALAEPITVGALPLLENEQENLDSYKNETWEWGDWDAQGYTVTTRYPTLNDMVMALNSGRAQILSLPGDVARYLASRTEGLYQGESWFSYAFQMALMPEQEALRDQLDECLNGMLNDGAIDALIAKWILGAEDGVDPALETIAPIEGAQTIRVGVTGDLPPMDYVSADGTPAGFNVALLGEISKRLNVNIELVQITGEARLVALSQGRIDVAFWYCSFMDASGEETNPGVITTVAYRRCPAVLVSFNHRVDLLNQEFTLRELQEEVEGAEEN